MGMGGYVGGFGWMGMLVGEGGCMGMGGYGWVCWWVWLYVWVRVDVGGCGCMYL